MIIAGCKGTRSGDVQQGEDKEGGRERMEGGMRRVGGRERMERGEGDK